MTTIAILIAAALLVCAGVVLAAKFPSTSARVVKAWDWLVAKCKRRTTQRATSGESEEENKLRR